MLQGMLGCWKSWRSCFLVCFSFQDLPWNWERPVSNWDNHQICIYIAHTVQLSQTWQQTPSMRKTMPSLWIPLLSGPLNSAQVLSWIVQDDNFVIKGCLMILVYYTSSVSFSIKLMLTSSSLYICIFISIEHLNIPKWSIYYWICALSFQKVSK